MMKKFFVLIVFVLLTQLSCDSISSQKSEPQNKNSSETSKISSENNKTENNNASKPNRLLETFEGNLKTFVDMVYASDFTSIAYGKEFGIINPGDTLAFRRETIFPQNIEKLRSFSEIDPSTIDKFVERNKTTEKLDEDYDVKHGIFRVDKKDSNENLLALLNQKRKDIKYLIGLSRIGYSEDFTQSLTYVEFYDLNKTLQRKYILITWEYYGQGGATVKDKKWFSAE